jgi:hypothetical protein
MKWLRRLIVAGLIGFAVRAALQWIRARKESGLDGDQAKTLVAAIRAAYDSTVQAFETSGDGDGDARDERAASAAEALRRTVDAMKPALSPRLQPLVTSLVDALATAQVQIMAFAINRKNRGVPDAAQTKAEDADRQAFVETAGPIYQRLLAGLS